MRIPIGPVISLWEQLSSIPIAPTLLLLPGVSAVAIVIIAERRRILDGIAVPLIAAFLRKWDIEIQVKEAHIRAREAAAARDARLVEALESIESSHRDSDVRRTGNRQPLVGPGGGEGGASGGGSATAA